MAQSRPRTAAEILGTGAGLALAITLVGCSIALNFFRMFVEAWMDAPVEVPKRTFRFP
jgi:hypothetical protein